MSPKSYLLHNLNRLLCHNWQPRLYGKGNKSLPDVTLLLAFFEVQVWYRNRRPPQIWRHAAVLPSGFRSAWKTSAQPLVENYILTLERPKTFRYWMLSISMPQLSIHRQCSRQHWHLLTYNQKNPSQLQQSLKISTYCVEILCWHLFAKAGYAWCPMQAYLIVCDFDSNPVINKPWGLNKAIMGKYDRIPT